MPAFFLTRLLRTILVVSLATLTGFALVVALPGDRLTASSTTEGRSAQAATIVAPIGAQLRDYVKALSHGDLGTSTSENRPVREVIGEAIPATLLLAIPALIMALLVGVLLGSWSGWHSEHRASRLLHGGLLALYTVPDVILGTVALAVLAAAWGIVPAGGLADPRVALTGTTLEQWTDRAHHLVLPAIVLALSWSPALFRQQRQAIASLAHAPSMQVARAKGVPARRLLWTHALPQASLGSVALLGALLPTLVGGAVVVETLFAWPGMGRLMVHAVAVRDAPVMAGGLVLISAAVALGSLGTTLVAHRLDPRMRTRTQTRRALHGRTA